MMWWCDDIYHLVGVIGIRVCDLGESISTTPPIWLILTLLLISIRGTILGIQWARANARVYRPGKMPLLTNDIESLIRQDLKVGVATGSLTPRRYITRLKWIECMSMKDSMLVHMLHCSHYQKHLVWLILTPHGKAGIANRRYWLYIMQTAYMIEGSFDCLPRSAYWYHALDIECKPMLEDARKDIAQSKSYHES